MSAIQAPTRLVQAAAPADHDALAEIKRRLKAQVASIQEVQLHARGDGYHARLWLHPLMIQARADQQGIDDRTVRGAAASPQYKRLIADAIRVVNTAMSDRGLVISDYVIELG